MESNATFVEKGLLHPKTMFDTFEIIHFAECVRFDL